MRYDKVQVERVGKRIHLKTPFTRDDDVFQEYKMKCKLVTGAKWAPGVKRWTYPLDLEVCRLLREVWGDELEIGEALWAWATGERAKEAEANKLHGDAAGMDFLEVVDCPRIRTLAPTMWEAMQNRPYQPIAAKYMALTGTCLNGDQPGIGKTIETLGALIEAGVDAADGTAHVLVLAPSKSTVVVWEPEIHRWLVDYVGGATTTMLTGASTALRKNKDGSERQSKADDIIDEYLQIDEPGIHFLIANAEFVRIAQKTNCPEGTCDGYGDEWCPDVDKHKGMKVVRCPMLFNVAWDAIIADETHQWLINTTGKNASQVGRGFRRLHSVEGGMRVSLSGTPLKGKKHNIFGTINWLRPDVYTSKWRFIEEHWEVWDDGYGRIIGNFKEGVDAEKFFRRLRSIMIRRTKSELHRMNPKWMAPDKVYHDIVVPMEPQQRRAYDDMLRDAAVVFESGRLTAQGQLAEMTRLKQLAQTYGDGSGTTFRPSLPSGKFLWLLEFLDARGIATRIGKQQWGDLSDEVNKVCLASQFTSVVNLYAEELANKGIKSYVLTGATSDRDAARMVERWADPDDDTRVFLFNTKAGGVSITLDSADDIIIHDETWVPDESEQAEDRCHRASNVDHQLDVWYPRSEDTIESDIAEANEAKAINNHVVLDAKRGLAYARKHLQQKGSKQ